MTRAERVDLSDVTVTFIDGTQKVYRITAGSTISPYLARQCGETGTLLLLAGPDAYAIPVSQIREWHIREVKS